MADSKNHSGLGHAFRQRCTIHRARGCPKCGEKTSAPQHFVAERICKHDSHTRASITSINAGGASSDSPTPTSTSREAASYRAAHYCADVVEFTHGYDVRERARDLDQRPGRSLRPRFKRRTDDPNYAVRRTSVQQRKQHAARRSDEVTLADDANKHPPDQSNPNRIATIMDQLEVMRTWQQASCLLLYTLLTCASWVWPCVALPSMSCECVCVTHLTDVANTQLKTHLMAMVAGWVCLYVRTASLSGSMRPSHSRARRVDQGRIVRKRSCINCSHH